MEHVHSSGGGGPRAAQADAKKAVAPTPDLRVEAKKAMTVIGSSGSSGGGSKAAQVGAKEALEATSNPKMATKRTAMVIGSSGSSPPRKRFHATWTCQGLHYVLHFESFLFLYFLVRVY
jgi:hypothetical protein